MKGWDSNLAVMVPTWPGHLELDFLLCLLGLGSLGRGFLQLFWLSLWMRLSLHLDPFSFILTNLLSPLST